MLSRLIDIPRSLWSDSLHRFAHGYPLAEVMLAGGEGDAAVKMITNLRRAFSRSGLNMPEEIAMTDAASPTVANPTINAEVAYSRAAYEVLLRLDADTRRLVRLAASAEGDRKIGPYLFSTDAGAGLRVVFQRKGDRTAILALTGRRAA